MLFKSVKASVMAPSLIIMNLIGKSGDDEIGWQLLKAVNRIRECMRVPQSGDMSMEQSWPRGQIPVRKWRKISLMACNIWKGE